MQAQIREGEMHLAQGCESGVERAAEQQFLVLLLRQWFAGLPVPGHAHQGGAIQAPVLHELARQFDGIPLDVVDASGLRLLHGGEHVLESMAEFVEEGLDLFETHQAWGLAHRWGLVADQVGHRQHRLPFS